MYKRITVLGLMLAVLVCNGDSARACSCPEPAPVSEQLEQRDMIFVGRVDSVQSDSENPGLVTAQFTVLAYWSGEPGREISVATTKTTAACGVPFTTGSTYLVFGDIMDNGRFGTNLCLPTTHIDRAQEMIERLGEARIPLMPDAWSGITIQYREGR